MTFTVGNFSTGVATTADRAALNLALSYLDQSPTAVAFLEGVIEAGFKINFVHGDQPTVYHVDTQVIDWNPNIGALVVENPSGGWGVQDGAIAVGVRSAAVALIHEIAHALDPNPIDVQIQYDPDFLRLAEKYAIEQENIVATELGEPERHYYSGYAVQEANPTEHTTNPFDGSLSEGTLWVTTNASGGSVVQGAFQIEEYNQVTSPKVAPVFTESGSTIVDTSGSKPWVAQTSVFDISITVTVHLIDISITVTVHLIDSLWLRRHALA